MSLLSPVRTKTGTLEHVRGAKIMKATDHSKWHRQKQCPGPSTNTSVKPRLMNGVKKATRLPLNGEASPECGGQLEQDEGSQPSHHKQADPVVIASLQKLLASPLPFVPASRLTKEDEQRSRHDQKQPRKVLSDEHRSRRQRTNAISKLWPRPHKMNAASSGQDVKSNKPLGLDNPHNFCYRRSVLQAFLHLPILYNWLQEIRDTHSRLGKHSSDVRCLACDFSHLAQAIHSGSRTTLRTRLLNFDRAIRALAPKQKQYPWLTSTSQADAHEFMLFVIDVYQDLLHLPRPIISGLFKLQVLSQWTCTDCHTTHTATPVDETGISLSLRHAEASTSLTSYLHSYFHDTVDDARCENPLCQSKANRQRTRTINAAPEVLFVQLMRFEQHYDKRSGRFRASKDTKPVAIEEVLDLSAYAVSPGMRERGSLVYRLSSVVAHAGSLLGGHYVAYAAGPGGVMEFNDDMVRACSVGKMMNPGGGFTPYILTYTAVEEEA